MDRVLNRMKLEATRATATNAEWSVGTVSSFDGGGMAKVQLQPEDTITGWLPINTASLGMNCGPRVGASCLVHFQNGDREAGIILGFFYTDVETPPAAAEDEIIIATVFGQTLKFLKDGTVGMASAAGASLVMDASGNIILTPGGGGQVLLGGAGATLKAARDADPTAPGNVVHATSTKVRVL